MIIAVQIGPSIAVVNHRKGELDQILKDIETNKADMERKDYGNQQLESK